MASCVAVLSPLLFGVETWRIPAVAVDASADGADGTLDNPEIPPTVGSQDVVDGGTGGPESWLLDVVLLFTAGVGATAGAALGVSAVVCAGL
jgi:hypothetical protein